MCEPFFSGVTASNECEGGASELLEMRRPAWYLYSSNPIIIIEVNERLSSNQSEAGILTQLAAASPLTCSAERFGTNKSVHHKDIGHGPTINSSYNYSFNNQFKRLLILTFNLIRIEKNHENVNEKIW